MYEIVRALFCAGGDGQCGCTSGYTLDTTSTRPSSLLPLPLGPLTTDLGRSAACRSRGFACVVLPVAVTKRVGDQDLSKTRDGHMQQDWA